MQSPAWPKGTDVPLEQSEGFRIVAWWPATLKSPSAWWVCKGIGMQGQSQGCLALEPLVLVHAVVLYLRAKAKRTTPHVCRCRGRGSPVTSQAVGGVRAGWCVAWRAHREGAGSAWMATMSNEGGQARETTGDREGLNSSFLLVISWSHRNKQIEAMLKQKNLKFEKLRCNRKEDRRKPVFLFLQHKAGWIT